MRILCLFLLLLSIPALAAPFDQQRTVGDSFGVQLKDDLRNEREFDHIKETGFGVVRIDMHWGLVEKEKGQYDWGDFDKIMPMLRERNLKAVIILSGGNPVYSGFIDVPAKIFGVSKMPPSPTSEEEIKGFADFAATAVKRYGSDDIIWEIWNEPNGDSFWVPEPNAADYTRFASVVCQEMREASPQAQIIGPALSGMAAEKNARHADFMEAIFKSPLVSCLDAFSFHPYRDKSQTPESVIVDYAQTKKFIAAHMPKGQKPLPLMNSEWGYSLTYVTPQEQAAYALRGLLSSLIAGVPLSIWYEWRGDYPAPLSDKEAHFGLVDHDREEEPAVKAVRDFLEITYNAVFEKRIMIVDPQIYAVLLRKPDGKKILVYWSAHAFADDPVSVLIGKTTYNVTPMPQISTLAHE